MNVSTQYDIPKEERRRVFMTVKSVLFLTILTLCLNCHSQTVASVNKLKSSYQNCLDKGENMKVCAVEYYNQSDSLLNVVYKKLNLKLSADQQSALKKEQLDWLKKT